MIDRPDIELGDSAAQPTLDAIVDGADYRCEFSHRSAWSGTARRGMDGQVVLIWHGATSAQDRVFPLALEDGRIVVTNKPSWGSLVKLMPTPVRRDRMPRRSPDRKLYRPHPDRVRRLASAVALARFAAGAEDLLDAHRREVLSVALWFATEADGKYRLRYRSLQARALPGEDRRLLRHDHVVTRKQLIDAMLRDPSRTEEIVRSAVACVVTEEEHKRLTALGETYQGWDRYITATIDVFDEQEGVALIQNGQFLNQGQALG